MSLDWYVNSKSEILTHTYMSTFLRKDALVATMLASNDFLFEICVKISKSCVLIISNIYCYMYDCLTIIISSCFFWWPYQLTLSFCSCSLINLKRSRTASIRVSLRDIGIFIDKRFGHIAKLLIFIISTLFIIWPISGILCKLRLPIRISSYRSSCGSAKNDI
jgi:hypothetical protein